MYDAIYNNQSAKPGVSENYLFIPTPSIIDVMNNEGFEVTRLMQGKSRKENGQQFIKHRVHFQKKGQQHLFGGTLAPEVILINSHDRTSALRFLSGIIVFACENGLVAGDIYGDTGKIYHTESKHNTTESVLSRVQNIAENSERDLEMIARMKDTELSFDEQVEIAFEATKLPVFKNRDIKYFDLLNPNRWDDVGSSLWQVFNTIQENLKKGTYNISSLTNKKIRKARPIRSIDTDLKYNQQLWNLALQYAE